MNKHLTISSSSLDLDHAQSFGHKVRQSLKLSSATSDAASFFIVTPQAFYTFSQHNNLHTKLGSLFRQIDPHDPTELASLAKNIRNHLKNQPVPKSLSKEIAKKYHSLKSPWFKLEASYPSPSLFHQESKGDQIHKGDSVLIHLVREEWVSLFTPKTIHAHSSFKNMLTHFPALIVREAPRPHLSGTIYTIHPLSQNKSQVVVTALYGEKAEKSTVPDTYVYNKKDERIEENHLIDQRHMLVYDRFGHLKDKKVDKDNISSPKLTSDQVRSIAKKALKIHHRFLAPQEIDYIIDEKGRFVITNTKNLELQQNSFTLKRQQSAQSITESLPQIGSGVAASPGIVTAPVRILRSKKDTAQSGEIIVAQRASLDILPNMKKAVGVITEEGGVTSHAAILAREIGCPAVTGAAGIFKHLRNGQVVTIHGSKGKIYKGGHSPSHSPSPGKNTTKKSQEQAPIKTATKIFANLFSLPQAETLAKSAIDGVGLIRGEYAFTDFGYHPLHIKNNRSNEFIDFLSSQLSDIANLFGSRPLYYRFSLSNIKDYENLKYPYATDLVEPNPLLGFRGAAYHAAMPDLFDIEVQAIVKARNKLQAKNIKLVIPFVRTAQELKTLKRHIAAAGLSRGGSLELFAEISTPAAALSLKEIQDVNIDGIFIDVDTLAVISLGLDPTNHELQSLYHPLHPAITHLLEETIRSAHRHGLQVIVHGQAVNQHPDLLRTCIEAGVSAVCTSTQYLEKTRHLIANIEQLNIN